MIGSAISKNNVNIRLSEERWFHITESHDYMSGLSDSILDAINNPDMILKGNNNELIAIKKFNNKHLIVIYREVAIRDGFIITAFITSQTNKVKKGKEVIWKK